MTGQATPLVHARSMTQTTPHCRKSRPIFRDIPGSVDDLQLYCMEGNVPKLIVRDIFRNIRRFYFNIKNKVFSRFEGKGKWSKFESRNNF